MQKILLKTILLLIFFTTNSAISQNIYLYSTASGFAGGTSYSTLKASFDAVNTGAYSGTLFINVTGNTTETVAAVLNASGVGSASYTSILIQPNGGNFTISGNLATPLIDLNDADNVTINGINSATNSLTISNTNTGSTTNTSTIRFINDASNNIITNCSILGSSTVLTFNTGGTILFSTARSTTGVGNDNNTISNCNIGPAGTNLPLKAIMFGGTSATVQNNSSNTINNCNIYDFFGGGAHSSGVYCYTGSKEISIANNKFYQTASRTFTGANNHYVIHVVNTGSAEGMIINGNTIGFANFTGTGTYTLTGSTGKFKGIVFDGMTSATLPSSISNNVISNISLTVSTSTGALSASPFAMIFIDNGVVETNNNRIGSQTTTGSLVYSTSATTATDVYAICNDGVSNWTCNNNYIGGITAQGGASGVFLVNGIRANTGIARTATINNNIIGGSIANSIQNNSTSSNATTTGIHSISTAINAQSNTIRNMRASGGANTGSGASMIGIIINATSVQHTILQNTIHSLSNIHATAATTVLGFYSRLGTTAGLNSTVEQNLIYNITSATNSSTAEVNGLRILEGIATYKNNMIAIGEGINNAIQVIGMYEFLGTANLWHNTIYVSGNPSSGAINSYAFRSDQILNIRSHRNNIFYNARSNSGAASGKNYIVRENGTIPNPAGLTINNNIYYGTGTGNVFGFFNSVDVTSLSAWQTAVGQDANSYNQNPLLINPSSTQPDLHLQAINCVATGVDGADLDVANDYDGDIRDTTLPVIGADEAKGGTTTWNGAAWNNGAPNITKTAILNGNYNTTTHGNFSCCTLTVNTPFTLRITANSYVEVENEFTNNGTINVNDDGSLVQNNDASINSGDINVERTTIVNASDYVYWSTPVLGQSLATQFSLTNANLKWDWSTTASNANGTQGNWIPYNTVMNSGKGYIVGNSTAGTINKTFTGEPNNGVISQTIYRGSTTGNTNDNWNLVGNPYPSAIGVNEFLTANAAIEGFINVWTHGQSPTSLTDPFYQNFVLNYYANDYIQINSTGSTSGPGDYNIGSCQGFMVAMDDGAIGNTTLTFNNSMRDKGFTNTTFYRSTTENNKGKFWIDLVSATENSRTLVGYIPQATNNLDDFHDAFTDYRSNLKLYSLIEDKVYGIQGKALPFVNTDLVPMGIKVPTNGNYTIAIGAVEGLFANNGQTIYLEDKLLDVVHNLTLNPYTFTSNSGIHNNRFVIRYTDRALNTNDFDLVNENVFVFSSNNEIKINSTISPVKSYVAYNILGQTLATENNINSNECVVKNVSRNNQALLVKTTLNNGQVVTRKLIY